jgi:hypothetical protein
LQELDLGETGVDDQGLETVLSLPALMDLNLMRAKVTSAGVQKLKGMKLKRLNIDDVAGIDNSCLPAISEMKSLEFLHLGKTAITDEGVAVLGELPNLKTLILENTKVSDAAIEQLKLKLPKTDIKTTKA